MRYERKCYWWHVDSARHRFGMDAVRPPRASSRNIDSWLATAQHRTAPLASRAQVKTKRYNKCRCSTAVSKLASTREMNERTNKRMHACMHACPRAHADRGGGGGGGGDVSGRGKRVRSAVRDSRGKDARSADGGAAPPPPPPPALVEEAALGRVAEEEPQASAQGGGGQPQKEKATGVYVCVCVCGWIWIWI